MVWDTRDGLCGTGWTYFPLLPRAFHAPSLTRNPVLAHGDLLRIGCSVSAAIYFGEEVLWRLNLNAEADFERLSQPKNRLVPSKEDRALLEHVSVQVVPISPVRKRRVAYLPVRFELEAESLELVQTQLVSPEDPVFESGDRTRFLDSNVGKRLDLARQRFVGDVLPHASGDGEVNVPSCGKCQYSLRDAPLLLVRPVLVENARVERDFPHVRAHRLSLHRVISTSLRDHRIWPPLPDSSFGEHGDGLAVIVQPNGYRRVIRIMLEPLSSREGMSGGDSRLVQMDEPVLG